MTDGKTHDVKAAQDLRFAKDSIVVADRGYVGLPWMKAMDKDGSFFVMRGKENMQFSLKERPLDRSNAKNKNIQYD